jgi:D-amino peptidase
VGNSTISIHPELAAERIRAGVAQGLLQRANAQVPLPEHFEVEVEYRHAFRAYHIGFYPGASQVDPVTVKFQHDDYFEILRFLLFALWVE